jgi:thioredoxin reductase
MTEHDVIVVGGGLAGCSTAVFTARYGLDTVVLDRGNSSLQQCAFVENYLGFPGGIDVETLYAMMHAHVERVGGRVVDDMGTDLTVDAALGEDDATNEARFRVETQEGAYVADRVVAASTYDTSYLDDALGEHFLESHGETYLDPASPASAGRPRWTGSISPGRPRASTARSR